MNGFLWSSGHLGWGIFAVMVFTGLWVLLVDLHWRGKHLSLRRFATRTVLGWILGVVAIVIGFYLASR